MKKILLTKGQFALVDDADFDYLNQWKWYAAVQENCFYARRDITEDGKTIAIFMHRVLLNPSKNMFIDHGDGNGLNNQRSNLRLSTKQQNSANRGKQNNNTSGYKGVSWFKRSKKWMVQIMLGYKKIYLGLYEDKVDAARAYDKAALKYFGEFARLNFPRSLAS